MNTETMTSWQDFLAQHGAHIVDQKVQGFAIATEAHFLIGSNGTAGFISALTDQALLLATGEDAASFLHNQLSNDVEKLGQDNAKLACYCTPKGRMIASFVYWKTTDGIVLQLHASIKTAIHKRLQMFILRAKAKLSDISNEQVVLGLGGQAAEAALTTWFPSLPQQIYGKVDTAFGTLIRVADAHQIPRYQWIATNAIAQQVWPQLSKQLQPVDTSVWHLTNIQAGVAQIIDKTQEKFVPQMVNFELIGGVNFKKGCYPGQEIVARSQYLGKLKRRMAIARIAHDASNPIWAGSEVFAATEGDQPCGMIVNAEMEDAQHSLCLVEMKVADQENGDIHLGSATGEQLLFLPLPYAVVDITA